MPSDYYEKAPINADDIADLRIALETSESFKEFFNSEVFVKEYIKLDVGW